MSERREINPDTDVICVSRPDGLAPVVVRGIRAALDEITRYVRLDELRAHVIRDGKLIEGGDALRLFGSGAVNILTAMHWSEVESIENGRTITTVGSVLSLRRVEVRL